MKIHFVLAAAFAALSAAAAFKEGKTAIPAEWKGKSVRYEQKLGFCEVDVMVNGKKAGTAYAPDGSVEIAPFLKFGAENEITTVERKADAYYGRGDEPSGARRDGKHRLSAAALVPRTAVWIDDFFARPSWREKKIFVSVEIESLKDEKGIVEVELADSPDAKVLKRAQTAAGLREGSNVVVVELPWTDDLRAWEPVAHAKTYDCRVKLSVGGVPCDSRRPHSMIGLREIWREGREIMLNGHIQRFRGFWHQGLPRNANDVHKFGYNLAYETHKHWAYWWENESELARKSEAGIAVFAGMPSIYFVHDAIRRDPACTEQFRRSLKSWMRSWRNYPCIIAASTGVNQICPERNMRPEILGQVREEGGVVDNIEFAAGLARGMNPNCLYFSHADGTEADISSSNLYFNFTPLQEREEWLSQWATNGILPWYAAEFGAPYYACWFHSRVPEMTEWLAVYFGDRAYEEELDGMLLNSKAFASSCLKNTHGGWLGKERTDLYAFHPLAEEFSRLLVRRVNQAWRTCGQNGGLMYLQSWPWDKQNTVRDRQCIANGDFVAYIGGADAPTDKTHAYWPGSEVKKNLVFIWDGPGANEATAQWRIEEKGGGVVASGVEKVALRQGDVKFAPVRFTTKPANGTVRYRLAVRFSLAKDGDNPANATVREDSFDFEIYPMRGPRAPSGAKIALFDPEGKTAGMLDEFGLKYEKIPSLEAVPEKATRLIVGWRALSAAQGLEKLVPRVGEGLKILVMQQKADIWQALGFTVEDSMARQMYNVSLAHVDDRDLGYWALSPLADSSFGNVMKHDTRRGPRWTHTHAVSATPILIPQKAGFFPLVRGEFDLSYTALLEARHGAGSALFCAFDFEGRVGICPAATRVASATLDHFLADETSCPAKVYAAGKAAARLAQAMALAAEPYKGGKLAADDLLLAGPDAGISFAALEKAAGKGKAYVFANPRLASEAGIAGETGSVCRVRGASGLPAKLFAGVGPSLLRWRDALEVTRFKGARGFEVCGEGLFAIRGDRLFFDATDPFQACDRYRTDGGKAAVLARGGWGSRPTGEKDLYLRNASQSEDNHLRRLAVVFGNLGVGAREDIVARALYTKPAEQYEPVAQYNVLGPWPSEKDDDHYMVDTIFPVDESKGGDSGAFAEEMAIKGDVQPNPRFFPKGLHYLDETPPDLRFLDWRPVVKSRADGYVDYATAHPLIAAQSFCTCYCVGFLKRRTAGEITIRFGVDWRGKIWVNGKAFDPVYGGHKDEGSVIYEHVPVRAGDNVITVKAGCGQNVKAFWLNVSHEPQPGEVERASVPALDGVELYESANPRFDPYEYVYW